MGLRPSWDAVKREHDDVLAAYIARVNAIPDSEWAAQLPGRTWSPAEETLHLVKAYELPLGTGRMRLKVRPLMAWVLGTFYLRYLLFRRTFHQGARAPGEVRPDAEEARTIPKAELIARLQTTGDTAAEALRKAAGERPRFRLVHAYFGSLKPLTALRMLNAHTRHHTRAG